MNTNFTFSNSDDVLQMFDDIAAANNILRIKARVDGVIRHFSPGEAPHYIRYGKKHELSEIARLIISLKTTNEPYLTHELTPTILVVLTQYSSRGLMEAIISAVTDKPAHTYATAKQIAEAFAENGFKFESNRPVIDLNNDLVDFLVHVDFDKSTRARRAPISISVVNHPEKNLTSSQLNTYIGSMKQSHLNPIGVYIDRVNDVGHCSTLCEQQLTELSRMHNVPIITRANHDGQ